MHPQSTLSRLLSTFLKVFTNGGETARWFVCIVLFGHSIVFAQSETFAAGSPLQAPVISISPSATTVTGTMLTLSFTEVTNATSYRLCYGSSPGNYISCMPVTSPYSIKVTDILNYYVAVKAENGQLESRYSNEIHLESGHSNEIHLSAQAGNCVNSYNSDIQINTWTLAEVTFSLCNRSETPTLRLRFLANAGQRLSISTISNDFNTAISVTDDFGRVIAASDDEGGETNSLIRELTIFADGYYYLNIWEHVDSVDDAQVNPGFVSLLVSDMTTSSGTGGVITINKLSDGTVNGRARVVFDNALRNDSPKNIFLFRVGLDGNIYYRHNGYWEHWHPSEEPTPFANSQLPSSLLLPVFDRESQDTMCGSSIFVGWGITFSEIMSSGHFMEVGKAPTCDAVTIKASSKSRMARQGVSSSVSTNFFSAEQLNEIKRDFGPIGDALWSKVQFDSLVNALGLICGFAENFTKYCSADTIVHKYLKQMLVDSAWVAVVKDIKSLSLEKSGYVAMGVIFDILADIVRKNITDDDNAAYWAWYSIKQIGAATQAGIQCGAVSACLAASEIVSQISIFSDIVKLDWEAYDIHQTAEEKIKVVTEYQSLIKLYYKARRSICTAPDREAMRKNRFSFIYSQVRVINKNLHGIDYDLSPFLDIANRLKPGGDAAVFCSRKGDVFLAMKSSAVNSCSPSKYSSAKLFLTNYYPSTGLAYRSFLSMMNKSWSSNKCGALPRG